MCFVSLKTRFQMQLLARCVRRLYGALLLSFLVLLLAACGGAQAEGGVTPTVVVASEGTNTPAAEPGVTLPPPGGGAAVSEELGSGEGASEEAATATPEPFAPPDLAYLASAFDAVLEAFDGLGSYYVVDLQSGVAI